MPDDTQDGLRAAAGAPSRAASRVSCNRASRVTRRTVLKGTAAAAGMGPWLVRDALASSGYLDVMMWSDYFPRDFVKGFERKTGIRIRHTPYGSNEELLNRVKAAKGLGYDLVGPTVMRAPQWRPLGLLQPFDMKRVPTARIAPAMLKQSTELWTWNGKLYHLPYLWGTEALAWRTDKWSSEYGKLSYGDLWTPAMRGLIMGRPHSLMLTIGLYLDGTGELPSNRMLDAYKDEANMRRIWGEITRFAVAHKANVKLFWDDAETQRLGFLHNGVVLGQTWDGPAIALKNEGQPINYMAPKEGALAWLDGLSILRGARNVDQIYAFLDYIYRPKVGGQLASETGYNAVAKGAGEYLSAAAKRDFREAYPKDALERLWWWPPEPPWYAAARNEYRDRFVAA